MGWKKLIKVYCKAWPEIWKCFEKSIKEALSPAGVNLSDKVIAALSMYISWRSAPAFVKLMDYTILLSFFLCWLAEKVISTQLHPQKYCLIELRFDLQWCVKTYREKMEAGGVDFQQPHLVHMWITEPRSTHYCFLWYTELRKTIQKMEMKTSMAGRRRKMEFFIQALIFVKYF